MAYLNGRLPASQLSAIPGGRLRKGAPARSWLAMRYFIAKKTGGKVWLRPTGPMSSYRTLAQQQILWNRYVSGKGALAARPGSSNHGSATRAAVDVPTPEMQAAVRRWGHLFGWGIAGGQITSDAPNEPWHCTRWDDRINARTRAWHLRWRMSRKGKR
jgi:hypothetical protein